jgi:hypothetical protein
MSFPESTFDLNLFLLAFDFFPKFHFIEKAAGKVAPWKLYAVKM